jgi:hypothetical protein
MSKRKPISKGFHSHETLHLRSKVETPNKTNITSEGTGLNINIHVNPKGDGRIIFDKGGLFKDITVTGTISGEQGLIINGDSIFNNNVEVEGTLFADTIEERISGCNEGVTIEGVRFKNGKIFSEEIETQDLTTFTTSTEQETTDRIITYNDGETGAGMSDTDKMSGFRVDRGSLDDYLLLYDDVDQTLRTGFYDGDDGFPFDRDCVISKIVHASDTISQSLVPYGITGNAYAESNRFTFNEDTYTLNVDGNITISGSSLAFVSYVNSIRDVLQAQIDIHDTDIALLQTQTVTISGDLNLLEQQVNDLDGTYASDAQLVALSGNLQTQIWNNDTDIDNLTVITDDHEVRITIDENNIVSISGNLNDLEQQVNDLDDTYASDAQLVALSGNLQTQIWDNDTDIDNLTVITDDYGTRITINENNIVSISGNVAQGLETVIDGISGTVIGNIIDNVASGEYSLAEGNNTTASGDDSHAEGQNTIAQGGNSHAEGNSTTAAADDSHAEGFLTNATGSQSHTEGVSTTASNTASHAEGISTTASGRASHAEGISTTASGRASHAGGENAQALHDNTYVWSDGNSFQSTESNSFNVFASGGVHLEGDVIVTNDILPAISGGSDLGSIDKPFRDLYLTENSIYLGSNVLSISGGALQLNGTNEVVDLTNYYTKSEVDVLDEWDMTSTTLKPKTSTGTTEILLSTPSSEIVATGDDVIGDFENVEANVSFVTDHWENDIIPSDRIIDNRTYVEGVSFWTLTTELGGIDACNGTGNMVLPAGTYNLTDLFVVDLATSLEILTVQMLGSGTGPLTFSMWGSDDWNGSSGSFTKITNLSAYGTPYVSATSTPYRYVKFRDENNNWGAQTITGFVVNSLAPASLNNTFDAVMSFTGTKSFAPATFIIEDENDAEITGSGNVNIAYEINGIGGFSSLIDLQTFKGLSATIFTNITSLKIRIQLVGLQQSKDVKLSTTSAGVRLDENGLVEIVVNAVVTDTLSDKADVSFTNTISGNLQTQIDLNTTKVGVTTELKESDLTSLTSDISTTANISGSAIYANASNLDFSGLSTIDPGISGRLWHDMSGFVKISFGI